MCLLANFVKIDKINSHLSHENVEFVNFILVIFEKFANISLQMMIVVRILIHILIRIMPIFTNIRIIQLKQHILN